MAVVLTVTAVVVPSAAVIAQETDESPPPELEWSEGVSDVPVLDLSGTYLFDPAVSDPMVEAWRDREVEYVVTQTPERIRLEFRPRDGEPNVQAYAWDGSVARFERGTAQVRERARWIEGGRVLEIEGRWWLPEDPGDVRTYVFRYRREGPDELVFTQIDEHGRTEWRFRRR